MNRIVPIVVAVAALLALLWFLRPVAAPGEGGPTSILGTPTAEAPSSNPAPDAPPQRPPPEPAPEPDAGAGAPSTGVGPSEGAPPAWVPADAVGPTTGAIVAIVRLAEGVPAAGAAASLSGPAARAANTGAEGRLVFPRLPPGGGYRLVVGAWGYATVVRPDVTVAVGKVTDLGTLDLAGEQGEGAVARATIKVVADKGGAPIAGARVVITTVRPHGLYLAFGTEGRPGEVSVEKTTGEDGRATLEGVRPGSYDVLAFAPGFAMGLKENVVLRHDSRETIELKLPEGLKIVGRVLDPRGGAAAGAAVVSINTLKGYKSYPMVTTDAEGRFAVESLDPGAYLLFAFKEGEGSAQASQPVRPGPDDVVLQLKSGGTLTGQVVAKLDGSPIPVFTIRPYLGQPFGYVYSMAYPIASPEGRFALAQDLGLYTLEVAAEGYAMAEVKGVKVPTAEGGIRIELEAPGVIRGTVRRKGTGQPIPGAEVYVRKGGMPPSPHKVIYALTGPEGEFRLGGLALLPLNLHVTHAEHAGAELTGVVPQVGEPAPVVVELSAGGAIDGAVLGRDGLPAAGVPVSLGQGLDFLNFRTLNTGPDGRFKFDPVTPGKYWLAAGEFVVGSAPGQVVNVKVVDGEVATVQLGAPARGGVDVTGRVTRAGAPVPDVSVSLGPRDRVEGGGPVAVQAKTDADGRFTFPAVEPGRYVAFVEVTGAVARRNLEVTADGSPPLVELTLEPARIAGRVLDVEGKPVGGVWATLEVVTSASGGFLDKWHGQATTAADGSFAIGGLADGTYRLRVLDMFNHAYGSELVDAVVISAGQAVENLVVTLKPSRQIEGRVVRADGAPIESANLRAIDSQGRDVAILGFSTTGSDGAYTYGGLRADVYVLIAEAPGFAPAARTADLTTAVSQRADFTLAAGATFRVVAVDGEGKAVASAEVEVLHPDGSPVTKGVSIVNLMEQGRIVTNAQGVALWPDLAAGSYGVRVTKTGKTPAQVNASAVAGSEVEVKVTVGG